MACLLQKKPTKRRIVRQVLAFLVVAGVFALPQPVLAASGRTAQEELHDQVFRFIEGVKGKTTAKRYSQMIVASAKKHGLEPLLVANLILTESSFNPKAISPMGAIGLMQVMPFHYTKRRIPIAKWHDPAINIDLGCQIYASYLRMMDKRYPGLTPSALRHRALVAYNMGPRAVISRGIYRSRYSQKVSQKVEQFAAVPKPSRPIPLPPPPERPEARPEARPEDVQPVRWEQLPLSNTTLSFGVSQAVKDALRVGHPLPEMPFDLPLDPSQVLP